MTKNPTNKQSEVARIIYAIALTAAGQIIAYLIRKFLP